MDKLIFKRLFLKNNCSHIIRTAYRAYVAEWWCSVPSVRKVAGSNSTLAAT